MPLIAAGKSQGYDYRPTPGTHWMHSHHGLQEQALLAAPLIVHSEEDLAADVQEVTVLLHDFSFRQPEEILAGLTGGPAVTTCPEWTTPVWVTPAWATTAWQRR